MRMERFPGRRRAVPIQARPMAKPYTFPAPIAGWVSSKSLVKPPPLSAQVLENWFPTSTGLKARGGAAKRATIGGDPVESFITYNAGGTQKLFACDEENIYDVTSVGDPEVPPSAAVTGQTSGYYSYINFTTSGGSFVLAVNGTDDLLLYDPGTIYAGGWIPIDDLSTPAITGVTTANLSHVWLYRNRVFFIQDGTMKAHYLGVDSIAGALGTLNLSGVFHRGGSLLFGATWSISAGDGIDEKCVFITTEGEAAVYEGANPAGSTAADWNLVGRYDLTQPLGRRVTMRAGGDLIIATKEGLVPMSAVIAKDAAALSLAAVSSAIEPDWKREVSRRTSMPWELIKWPEQNYAITSLPVTSVGQEAWSFIVNLETGAWTKFVGWATRCLEYLNGRVYFGTNDGEVFEAEIGGKDDDQPIYYTMVGNPDSLKFFGQEKTVHEARPTFRAATPYNPVVSFSTNYVVELPSAPDSADEGAVSDLWDSGLWDVALWDQDAPTPAIGGGMWIAIGKSGYVHQPQLQVTGFSVQRPDIEFLQLDVTFEIGGIVV